MIDGYQFNKRNVDVAACLIHPCDKFERKLKTLKFFSCKSSFLNNVLLFLFKFSYQLF